MESGADELKYDDYLVVPEHLHTKVYPNSHCIIPRTSLP